MQPITTPRLVLRPFTLADAPFILRLLNEPSFIENIADKGVRTLAQAEDYLRGGPMASYQQHGHGLLGVELRASQKRIGMCGLLKREELPHVDLGYAFLPEAWSQGFAREAAEGVLAQGHPTLGPCATLAIVHPGNAPSIRLLEKVGFTFVKVYRKEGEASDTAMYERLPLPPAGP